MPVNNETISEVTNKIIATYNRFALGNEGSVHVDRLDVNYPNVNFKVIITAKQTFRNPLTGRREILFRATFDVEGNLDLTNIDEAADKLTLTIHTKLGNPSVSLEDAKQLVEFMVAVLA